MSSAYFEHETYSDVHGFHATNERNQQVIREMLVPRLMEHCRVKDHHFDKDPLKIPPEFDTDELERTWIDPEQDIRNIRPPDILTESPEYRFEGCNRKQCLEEFKDYSQMNRWPLTGIRLVHLRRYVAIQHHFLFPIACLFRDNQERENDVRSRLPRLRSAFKERGEFLFYGGLIFDMVLCAEKSVPWDDQVRWVAQEDEHTRVMMTLTEIFALLKSGRIKLKVAKDPNELPLWRLIQPGGRLLYRKERTWHDYPPLRHPEGGLRYFSAL